MAKKKAKKTAKRTAKKRPLDLTLPIFQLKIGLQHIQPPIWRRVQTGDCPLDELHDIIQTAMGWQDEHLYAFVVNRKQYGDLERDDFEYDARSIRLSELAKQGHTRFQYDYDFGDDWKHVVEIEKTLPVEEGVYYPRCMEGERAGPPEDCGGPYEYPYFLKKLQDPEDEEHEDIVEWADENFDPEKFALEEINDGLRYLRRFLGHREGKQGKAAFAEEDLVQVNPGIVHDRYPDIPLGGWVGNITRVAWLTPIGYEIEWTEATLQQAPPVYHKRYKRDGFTPETYWLEADQLSKAPGESPVAMEQPTNLITRPLSMDEDEDRVRAVFGLTSDDPLPKADEQAQQQFLDYLKTRLSFPFKAEYFPSSPMGPDMEGKVTVLGFSDPPLDPDAGIVCEARMGKQEIQVPLAGLHVDGEGPNSEYVEDYTFWLWDAAEKEEFEKLENDDDDFDDDEDFEDDNDDFDDDDEESEDDEDFEDEELNATKEEPQFPIGTVALYGPDNRTTTKIVAGVIKEAGAEPMLQRWVVSDVMTNPKVQKEIERFLKKHGVKTVAMSEENLGCPHEEGEDFPVGGDCPFCPWWKGKQGSGATE